LTEMAAFPILSLQEPDKNEVLNFKPNRPFQRQAFIMMSLSWMKISCCGIR
jgi:primary-amine oxidase